MLPSTPKNYRRAFFAALWLALTLSLTIWWMVYGLRELHQLGVAQGPAELVRHQRMLLSEGSFLILVVLAGGIALLYFSYLDLRRHEQLKTFFSSFSHDIKTSLASLRLQAEIIEEGLEKPSPNLQRLLRDVVRLELQLENSLFLANADSRFFQEKIELSRITERVQRHWPELQVALTNNAQVLADQRALESVLKNLIQNARIHGEAQAISITASPASGGRVEIRVADDGKGFSGTLSELGAPHLRPHPKSGSGLGVYLSRELLRRMGGNLEFTRNSPHGLVAVLSLPGEPL